MDRLKVTYTEDYELTEKEVFLLLEIDKVKEVRQSNEKHNWFHLPIIKPLGEWKTYMERDEEKSYDDEWCKLSNYGFIVDSDVNFYYCVWILTPKGKQIVEKIKSK